MSRLVGPLALLLFLFLLLLTSALFAQTSIDDVHITPREPHQPNITDTTAKEHAGLDSGIRLIRADVNLVMVPVTITDNLNRPVTGLDRDNFELFEDKKPQEIKNFSSEDTPVSVGLIVDTSGSMINKMDKVREAVHQFCEAANPQDEFFMITFSDEPQLATDFTNDGNEVETDLGISPPRGRTSLLDAIYMGLRKMHDARYQRRALLILSDGGDNHSRYSERDVKSAVKEADVLLYAVGTFDTYVSTQEEMLGPELLQNITGVTGGKAFTLTNIAELPAVTRAISTQLRHQYVLAYRPQAMPKDGKWYKINVKLRLPKRFHAFLRVDARTGYYASAR
ncbi:MAG TPA: VWA domain-containing protein [Candidatus Sulfotelmatobacter sp.]|nr:VWA domain-containing protein [Candidatus Sulfotelmatobacter sp.]